MTKLLLVAAGGALGALCRYGLSGFVHRFLPADYPFGTTAVNVLGCFLFGLVWILVDERYLIRAEGRIFLLVGFMGAFTTFSTYIFETGQLMSNFQWLYAGLNLTCQIILGFLALTLGMAAGRLF